jgi:hypothetical protein
MFNPENGKDDVNKMKKLYLKSFGWPLFRDYDTLRRHGFGLSGAGGGVAGGSVKDVTVIGGTP